MIFPAHNSSLYRHPRLSQKSRAPGADRNAGDFSGCLPLCGSRSERSRLSCTALSQPPGGDVCDRPYRRSRRPLLPVSPVSHMYLRNLSSYSSYFLTLTENSNSSSSDRVNRIPSVSFTGSAICLPATKI